MGGFLGAGLEMSGGGAPGWIWWVVGLGVVLAGLVYLGLPLVIKSSLVLRGRPTVRGISVGEMPEEVYRHFGQSAPGLQACGFAIKAYVHIPDMVPNAVAYLALWTNESAGQMAVATVIYAQAPNVLAIFGFIPVLGWLVAFIGSIWAIVTAVVAIRETLAFSTSARVLRPACRCSSAASTSKSGW